MWPACPGSYLPGPSLRRSSCSLSCIFAVFSRVSAWNSQRFLWFSLLRLEIIRLRVKGLSIECLAASRADQASLKEETGWPGGLRAGRGWEGLGEECWSETAERALAELWASCGLVLVRPSELMLVIIMLLR